MVLVMTKEENCLNKRLYKTTIGALKVIPMLLAFCACMSTFLDFFGVKSDILSYIGGVSLLPLLFLYLVSYVFEFCLYHRLFLHYIVVNLVLNTLDLYVGIPLSIRNFFVVHCIVVCAFLFLILYFHQKEKCCK